MDISRFTTADGSHTLLHAHFHEPYHSRHGAIAESMHVFIAMGLQELLKQQKTDVQLLEMGFGTGLNVLLTALQADTPLVRYHALEKYPISSAQHDELNYKDLLKHPEAAESYQAICAAEWGVPVTINPKLELTKFETDLLEFEPKLRYDLVYYDAFAPSSQPELWTEAVFQKCLGMMKEGGILVTYCAKGSVRRAMQAVGFQVERLPGPPFKREMLRARK